MPSPQLLRMIQQYSTTLIIEAQTLLQNLLMLKLKTSEINLEV